GDQAIVASICPKVVRSANPDSDPNYGYNPAIAALLKQLVSRLSGRCLPRPPSLQPSGETACAVIEARLDGKCDCQSANRTETSPDALLRIRENLERDGLCKGNACDSVCACGIPEARDQALEACRSTAPPEEQSPSFCYVEPDAGLGDPALVRDCPANQRRLLRFVGQNTPAKGSLTYMACFGATSNAN
ncbi:MAG TPA: hypothetical protein VFQ61_23995, partial [Polyangiaceae bacterium]|nr:hypothetical protein [Polyangiaceae bacterium]